jgi:hypothetical protein
MAIDYQTKIPNNVDLSNDRALQRALEHWQPAFLDWWKELGPTTYQGHDVYLRTATSVDAKGWATFGHVKMPEYRWVSSLPSNNETGLSLGHLPRRTPAGSDHRLWRFQGPARLAAGAGRVPLGAAPSDRNPRRYRAGLGRAAAPARADRAVAI